MSKRHSGGRGGTQGLQRCPIRIPAPHPPPLAQTSSLQCLPRSTNHVHQDVCLPICPVHGSCPPRPGVCSRRAGVHICVAHYCVPCSCVWVAVLSKERAINPNHVPQPRSCTVPRSLEGPLSLPGHQHDLLLQARTPGSGTCWGPTPRKHLRMTCLPEKRLTWQGRAPGCSPQGGWAGAVASTWSEAGGRGGHGPASHSEQPVAPDPLHKSLGMVPRLGSPTCRKKASALNEATPQGETPFSPGSQAAAPAVSFPTHRAGHGAAWQTSCRLPGLLAWSHSSS